MEAGVVVEEMLLGGVKGCMDDICHRESGLGVMGK